MHITIIVIYLLIALTVISFILYLYYKQNNPNSDNNLKFIIVTVSIAGLTLIVWASFNIDKHTDTCTEGMRIFFSTIANVGQAFVAGSIFAYLFELSQFRQYFERTVTNIVTGKEYLKNQDDEKLKEFRTNVTEAWYEQRTNKVDRSLIDLDNRISELLTRPYYKSYNESIDCEFDPSGKYIKKVLFGSIIIENPEFKEKDMFDFFEDTTYFEKIEGIENSELRIIENFQVKKDNEIKFSKNLSNHIKINFEDLGPRDYHLKSTFGFKGTDEEKVSFDEMLSTKEQIHIKWKETRKVPVSDTNYSFTIKHPTKYLSVSYIVKGNDNIRIRANCFGTLGSIMDGNIEVVNNNSQSVVLRSHKWMLNGNGAVFFLYDKKMDV